jgi:hypothetical protein
VIPFLFDHLQWAAGLAGAAYVALKLYLARRRVASAQAGEARAKVDAQIEHGKAEVAEAQVEATVIVAEDRAAGAVEANAQRNDPGVAAAVTPQARATAATDAFRRSKP